MDSKTQFTFPVFFHLKQITRSTVTLKERGALLQKSRGMDHLEFFPKTHTTSINSVYNYLMRTYLISDTKLNERTKQSPSLADQEVRHIITNTKINAKFQLRKCLP